MFAAVAVTVMLITPKCIVGASSTKYYWIGDIQDMSKQLNGYQADVSLHKSGAKKALDKFITSRLVLVAQTTIVSAVLSANSPLFEFYRCIGCPELQRMDNNASWNSEI